jgi:leucyl-tRNA synthetase
MLRYGRGITANKVVNTDLVDNQNYISIRIEHYASWAGSSFYWMRYMDAQNEKEFYSKEALFY